jgi:nicotinate-nucleotide--dimethylbenzimidazole phosphoribosyltransferase
MHATRSLVSPTSHPQLESALVEKLRRRNGSGGSLGQLEPLALRFGLMQRTLKPRFHDPQLLVFAADHGLAVDGLAGPDKRRTHELVEDLLAGRLPLSVFARIEEIELAVVDCGIAENLQAHDRLLMRKIAHGTRNSRVTSAMSVEQAHAAMRAGMELGNKLRGNISIFAGLGVGAHESAALVISRLSDCPIRDLLFASHEMPRDDLAHQMKIVHGALARHSDVVDPIEVLAAFGGFEVAMMAGVMLMASSRRHLLVIDGLPACAALMVASRIAPPVTDYCVFCRSHPHLGLDQALNLFRATALLELGMQSQDGTGAAIAWPMIRCAAALLTEVGDAHDAEMSDGSRFDDFVIAESDVIEDDLDGRYARRAVE